MAQIDRVYSKHVHKHRDYYSNWPPSKTFELGDYGEWKGGSFDRIGNIGSRFKIKFKTGTAGTAAQLEAIRTQYEGEEFTVHIIGFAKIVGDISDGARGVIWFFGVAFLVTALLLYAYTRSIWLTVLPLLWVVCLWFVATVPQRALATFAGHESASGRVLCCGANR